MRINARRITGGLQAINHLLCEASIAMGGVLQRVELTGETAKVVNGFQFIRTAYGRFSCLPVRAKDDNGFRPVNFLGECHQRCARRPWPKGEGGRTMRHKQGG